MAVALLLKRASSPLAFPGGNPGFDPSHVASSGIVFTAVPNGASFVNLLSAKVGAITATTSPVIYGAMGPSVNIAGPSTASAVKFTGQPLTSFPSLTIAGIILFTAISNNQYLFSSATTNGAGLNVNASGNLVLTMFGVATKSSSFAIAAGVPYFIAVSLNGTTNVNFLAVRLGNGQVVTSTTTGATPGSVNGTCSIGNGPGVTTSTNGNIAAVMFSSAYMPMPKLLQWAQDPWSFWYPSNIDLTAILTSGAALYNKTLTATCTSTSTLARGVAKTLSATCTSTSTLIRSIAKTLVATCTSALTYTANKITAGGTVFTKTLVSTCTSTATLITTSTFVRTLLATCTSTSVVIRSINKTLLATCTSTAKLIRSIAKILLATCTSTLTGLARKAVVTTKLLIATCTSSAVLVSAIKSLAGAVLSLAAQLRLYKPKDNPTIPGGDVLYLQNELQKVSNAFNAHVAATKSIDARLTAAGF